MLKPDLPTGALVITTNRAGEPVWNGKWRSDGRQIKRVVGPAWMSPNGGHLGTAGTHGWIKRAGKPQNGALSREDAIVALRALIASHAAEEARERLSEDDPTFLQAAERWYARAERRQRKPSTLANYRQVIDVYIAGVVKTGRGKRPRKRITTTCPFALKPMSAISKRDMRDWFDGMKPSPTKTKVHTIVKGICNYAVSEDWASQNVALAVEVEPTTYDTHAYDYFSVSEVERLIAAAADPYDAALYAAAALSGLRKGELLALQWRDIDFQHARITVRANLYAGKLDTPKSGKIRTVPLVPALARRLKVLMMHANRVRSLDSASYGRSRNLANGTRSLHSANRKRVSDFDRANVTRSLHFERAGDTQRSADSNSQRAGSFVFANPARARYGKPWADPAAANRRYKAALKRAKLRDLPFHSLRHHFGSQAVTVATLVQVKAWMGHADLRTTSRYLHVKSLSTDADVLARAFAR